jgi:hypothetical protein
MAQNDTSAARLLGETKSRSLFSSPTPLGLEDIEQEQRESVLQDVHRLKARSGKAKEVREREETFEEGPSLLTPFNSPMALFAKRDQEETQLTEYQGAKLIQDSGSDPINFTPSEAFPITKEMQATAAPGDTSISSNIVDFLFGGEMAVMGIQSDTTGLNWSWENLKQQWSEEPLWINALNTASLVGTMAFPAARAAWMSTRFGKVGSLLGRFGSQSDELQKFKTIGLLDESVQAKNLDPKTLSLLRKQEHYRSHYSDLAGKLEKHRKGEGDFGVMDKVRMSFAQRFANDYYKIANSIVEGSEDVRKTFYGNLDNLFKSEDLGKFFINVPEAAAGAKIYKHWLLKQNPNLGSKVKLSPQEKEWADALEVGMRSHQQEALDAGLIDKATIDKVGEMHIPALLKGTAKADLSKGRTYYAPLSRKATKADEAAGTALKGDDITILKPFEMPRLDSPTLKTRKGELPDIYDRLMKGELISDPTELTVRGLVTDRLLLNNYKTVTDIATNDKFSNTTQAIIAKYGSRKGAEKAGWVSLDNLQGNIPTTLKRMIDKKDAGFLGGSGELPWIRKEAFDDLFGQEGIFAQSEMAGNMFDLLTSIHKTSKTALSIPTHFQNLASNMAMLMQAGFNPISPKNLALQGQAAKAFSKIAKVHRKNKDAGDTKTIKKTLDNLGINLGDVEINGKTFNLNDEILDPRVRELIEESAFESVEGFANVERMVESLSNEKRLTKGVGKTFIKAKQIMQLGDKEGFRWFDKMTQTYLAEDMIPKMSYFLSLRGQGLSKEAAILEVGRRLPMYQTVGSAIKQGRKVMFPWATFPAEALRITKNNMMDNPLRMLPWLQLPGIMQSTMYSAGLSPGADEVEQKKRQLPMWAQRQSTVMAQGGATSAMGGGLTGAIAGGAAGARLGGGAGGLAGIGLGAAAGAAGAHFLTDKEQSDRLRGIVVDWLPHSALHLTSVSPDFGGEIIPFKDFQGFVEQMPVQPLPIMKSFVDVVSGRTAWGQDVGAEDAGDSFGKALSGFMGFLAPPFIQKYGLKTTTPDISYSKHLLGTHVPGDITNVSRALVDSGQMFDPITGKPGSFTHDFVLKNFGALKSWATDPATALTNESNTERHLQQVRSYASKNLAFFLENGIDDESARVLTLVQSTFSQQHTDSPRKAQEKYTEWLKSRVDQIGRHPRLKGWSKEEMEERLTAVSNFSSGMRGQARDQMMQMLHNQLTMRQLEKISSFSKERKEDTEEFEKF